MALTPETASTVEVERQLLPCPLPPQPLHWIPFLRWNSSCANHGIFIPKEKRSLKAAGISPGTAAGMSWGRHKWRCWLWFCRCLCSFRNSFSDRSVPSFCSNALIPASTIQMATSAQPIPENTSSQFNGIKTRTGVYSCLFQIPHLVYLKIMSKSSGISNASLLSSARCTKHDATKARHVVHQLSSFIWVTTNM